MLHINTWYVQILLLAAVDKFAALYCPASNLRPYGMSARVVLLDDKVYEMIREPYSLSAVLDPILDSPFGALIQRGQTKELVDI